jgi:hypothetical protein
MFVARRGAGASTPARLHAAGTAGPSIAGAEVA